MTLGSVLNWLLRKVDLKIIRPSKHETVRSLRSSIEARDRQLGERLDRLEARVSTSADQVSRTLDTVSEEVRRSKLLPQEWSDLFKHIYVVAQIDAASSSSKWLFEAGQDVKVYSHRNELIEAALLLLPKSGEFAEFGVFTGSITRFIAGRYPEVPYHAFDSFLGVPEEMPLTVGRFAFDQQGRIPDLPAHVTVHAGWFDDTLPVYRKSAAGSLAFLYIDCDLYSSVVTVFENTIERVREGTIFLFDDWYNFPDWERHSKKAFDEYKQSTGAEFRFLGATDRHHAAGFQCTKAPIRAYVPGSDVRPGSAAPSEPSGRANISADT